jgi:hypothetical protein
MDLVNTRDQLAVDLSARLPITLQSLVRAVCLHEPPKGRPKMRYDDKTWD